MRTRAALLILALALGGCGARDCQLGIANRDCGIQGSVLADFPQDDAICRSYGLSQARTITPSAAGRSGTSAS